MNIIRQLVTTFLLFVSIPFWAQKPVENKQKFHEIRLEIEKLLAYKSIAPAQIKKLMADLFSVSVSSEIAYQTIKTKVDKRLVTNDIQLIHSDLYDKQYALAQSKIPALKTSYPYFKSIEKLEAYADKKTYQHLKQELLRSRPKQLTIETAVGIFLPEQKGLTFNTFSPAISLGIYRQLHLKYKTEATRLNYFLNGVGMRVEYLESRFSLFPDSTGTIQQPSYLNAQLSLLVRRFLSFDIGYLTYLKSLQKNGSAASATLSLWLPVHAFSFGLQARANSNLKDEILFQCGFTVKCSLNAAKKFTKADKEELKTKLLRMKGI
jgi:hypothetical protein